MVKKWRILFLDTKLTNPNFYIGLGIIAALKDHPQVECVIRADYGNAIERARQHHCNLFFAFDGEQIIRSVCQRLKSICQTGIVWYTEDPYERSINIHNAALFDLVFTNDIDSVSSYGHKGHHLPFGAARSLHHYPVIEDDRLYRYDLFFAGTAWPNRVELIKKIQQGITGVSLKLALPSNEHLPEFNLNLPPSTYNWRVPNSEFCRIANQSRVVLSLHRNFSSASPCADNAVSAKTPGPRLFEVAMAGGFQLVDNSLPSIFDYYTEHEIGAFVDENECVEKIRYYLESSEQRIAMAKQAQLTTLAEHSYRQRIDTIFACLHNIDAAQEQVKLIASESRSGSKAKKRLLLVSHNILGIQPYGGVEVYQDMLLNKLKSEYDILFYVPDKSAPACSVYKVYDADYAELESINYPEMEETLQLSCTFREQGFAEILQKYQVDLVHFQHLIGHVPSLLYIVRALGIPSVFSFHDFHAVCHSFNLIGYDGKYCDITRASITKCDICLQHSWQAAPGSQGNRRAFIGRALSQVDVLHANSQTTANIIQSIYPHLNFAKQNIQGIPIESASSASHSVNKKSNCPIRCVIPGNFSAIKGAETLLKIFTQMKQEDVVFYILGRIDKAYEQRIADLKLSNLVVIGSYDRLQMDDWLNDMDVSLHLSVWPETYCLTLSEIWRAKCVPIVVDLGALGERVTHDVNGYKVPVDEPASVIDLLRKLIHNPSEIDCMRKNINQALFTDIKEHGDWLSETYQSIVASNDMELNDSICDGNINLKTCGIHIMNPQWLKRLAASEVIYTPQIPQGKIRRTMQYLSMFGVKATMRKIVTKMNLLRTLP